jgi:hypothetical protein
MAGAPLGTRTAAKQSESKSKLMPNLFESRGLRRLWASHELLGRYSGPEVRRWGVRTGKIQYGWRNSISKNVPNFVPTLQTHSHSCTQPATSYGLY